jgi:hypothetical protein
MIGMRSQRYGVPASAGGDLVGQGVWGSAGDFGSGRFPPAEAGTPCLVEGTPNRGLKLGIVGMGNRGFDGPLKRLTLFVSLPQITCEGGGLDKLSHD